METIPMTLTQCLACAWIGPTTEHDVHDCIPNPKIQSATLAARTQAVVDTLNEKETR